MYAYPNIYAFLQLEKSVSSYQLRNETEPSRRAVSEYGTRNRNRAVSISQINSHMGVAKTAAPRD